MRMNDHRIAFAKFLRRLVSEQINTIEWQKFIVTHYHDEMLEQIRRNVAKLSIDRDGGIQWSDSEIEKLQHWSRVLQGEAV